MLRRAAPALAALALTVAASVARAAPEGVREPLRLTAGPSEELLGDPTPDDAHVYFASNEGGAVHLVAVDLAGGPARPVAETEADATWPRVSPDGKRLAYIARTRDAAGDLCVVELDGAGREGRHRCLTGPESAELQAVWMPDGRAIAVVTRRGVGGALALERVPIDGGARETLLEAPLTSPAISPDGRWLAYVPLERGDLRAGAGFVGRAGRGIALYDLAARRPGPVIRFHLPGASGFPAFSRDGRWIYFSQYLNDTNLDGRIDAGDHAVVFRAPFDPDAPPPVGPITIDRAEQLTSAEWSCQYPRPGREHLFLTCLPTGASGSLDVFSLPLDGAVPSSWTRARLESELAVSRSRWERLLILLRTLPLARDAADRRAILRALYRLHLGLDELESADFYAREIVRLADAPTDPAARAGAVLGELVAHRRAERALDRGQLSQAFTADARARLARIRDAARSGPEAAALAALVESEILDVLGEKDDALAALRRVKLGDEGDALVLGLLATRATDLARQLDDRALAVDTLRALAEHPGLSDHERLDHAESLVAELLRGRAAADRDAALAAEERRASRGGELAFRLELERALVGLAPGRDAEEAVRARVFDLYRTNPSFERRRALIGATLRRAARADSEFLLYQFANTWVSGLPPDAPERRHAERAYRQVVLERAYVERARGQTADERGHFYGVTLNTDSLEAHVGFVEARLREGQRDVEAQYERRFGRRPDDPFWRFTRAYLAARRLPSLTGEARARAADEARAHLAIAERALPNRVEIHHLAGWIALEEFRATDDRARLLEATRRLGLALDLARAQPRWRAPILEALAVAQASVGNHTLALGHLDERARLPFLSARAEVAFRLLRARSLYHLDRDDDAAAEAERAVARIGDDPALAPLRPAALARASLAAVAAAAPPPEREWQLTDGDADAAGRALTLAAAFDAAVARAPSSDRAAARNRWVAALLRVSAALLAGRDADVPSLLAAAERASAFPGALDAPVLDRRRVPRPSALDARSTARLLLSGLRAEAARRRGDLPEAAHALTARRDELAARHRRAGDGDDEGLRDLAAVELQLAELAHRRDDGAAARAHLDAGLAAADAAARASGTDLDEVTFRLLEAGAALALARPSQAPARDALRQRLRRALEQLAVRRNPAWQRHRALLTGSLALLDLR